MKQAQKVQDLIEDEQIEKVENQDSKDRAYLRNWQKSLREDVCFAAWDLIQES